MSAAQRRCLFLSSKLLPRGVSAPSVDFLNPLRLCFLEEARQGALGAGKVCHSRQWPMVLVPCGSEEGVRRQLSCSDR